MALPSLKESELRTLLEVGKTLSANIDLDDVLNLVVDAAQDVMNVEAASLLLVDKSTNELYFQVADGEKGNKVKTIRLGMGEGIAGWVAQNGAPQIVNNVPSDPRFANRFDKTSGFQTREIIAVPVQNGPEIVGVLELMNKHESGGFNDHDLEMTQVLAGQAAVAIQTAQLHERIIDNERLAAVGQAVAGLAHCIKNILNGIKGGSYLVDKAIERDDAERLTKGWGLVKRNSDRMFDLVMDMLTYSKERQPAYEKSDANEMCTSVCELMEGKAREKSVAIQTDLDETLDLVTIDSREIHRCVLNLVSNAIDACPADNGVVTLRTQPGAIPSQFVIAIEDNGCGISPENMAKLFQAFFSTKGSKGTGLGLPVTHKIIREHGGRIEVESELDKGTAFRIHLPKAPATESKEAAQSA